MTWAKHSSVTQLLHVHASKQNKKSKFISKMFPQILSLMKKKKKKKKRCTGVFLRPGSLPVSCSEYSRQDYSLLSISIDSYRLWSILLIDDKR